MQLLLLASGRKGIIPKKKRPPTKHQQDDAINGKDFFRAAQGEPQGNICLQVTCVNTVVLISLAPQIYQITAHLDRCLCHLS